jgi:hypothetical protein
MQNRLDGAAEAQAASEKQLAELRSAIAAERAARPESVDPLQPIILSITVHLYSFLVRFFFRIDAARHLVDWLLRGKR